MALGEMIRVRCKPAEKAAFQAAAADDGLTLSEWLRRLGRDKIDEKYGLLVGLDVSGSNGDGHGDGNFQW